MSDNFKRQLPLNLISNAVFFGVNIIIGVWIVPYYLKHIGTEGYGFIPLATAVTAFVSLITISLNGSVSRYLVIDLHKKDFASANRTFSTAFWSIGVLSIVLVPIFAGFAFIVPRIFKIPPQISSNVQWLFFIVSISFIISVFSSVFSVSTFAHNRLDLRNAIDFGNLSVRTITIVLLFAFFPVSLLSVGIAYFAGSLAALGLSYLFFKRLTPELHFSSTGFDGSKLKELMGMGGWLTVNQIGALLFLQIDLIVVNLLFGAEQTGRYGAVLQWSVFLRSLAGVLSGVLSPMVFICYAQEQKDRIVTMSQKAVKFLGLGMALFVGLLCGFARPLLVVWLGSGFAELEPLFWLLTGHLVINLAVLPLFAINTALGHVRIPGLVTLGMGALNLGLAVFLAKSMRLGVYGVAAAGAVVLTIKNSFFTPIYAAHILDLRYKTFIKPLGNVVLLTGFTVCVGSVLSRAFLISHWTQLLLPMGIGFLVCSLVGAFLLGNDRHLVLSILRSRQRA